MIKTTCRLAITLGMITVSVVWIAHGLKLIPDTTEDRVANRLQLCESLAVTTSWFAENGNESGLDDIVSQIAQRSRDVASIRIMKNQASIAIWGDHPSDWPNEPLRVSSSERMSVDILANGSYWGRVQVSYIPFTAKNVISLSLLVTFCGSLVILLSWFYLNRTLKYLNPSRVVPNRVRSALDVITEGLVLQDNAQQIVLVNDSFSKIVGQSADELMGGLPITWDGLSRIESKVKGQTRV